MPLAEAQDFEDARRGFIAKDEPLVIPRADGVPVWDFASFGFIDGDAPDTVNPSLWRQARLNGQYGLFEVVPGIHQVRGYDISNMTLIEGKSGWIVVDPLTVEETAAAALELAREHLGDRPVWAVIFTHSHLDHFGGVEGVLPADTLEGGTHNPMAPPFDFLAKCFMPLIHRMGPSVELELRRHGFYPAGGGRFHARIEPVKKLSRLDLVERGPGRSRQARVLVSKLPEHVGQRELAVVRDKLKWREDECAIEAVQYPVEPGNAVALAIEAEHLSSPRGQ